MRPLSVMGFVVATVLLVLLVRSVVQRPVVQSVDGQVLQEYAGAYEWGPGAFVYLQRSSELGDQRVAFDESGEVRTLYPTDRDHTGAIISLT